MMRNNPKLDLVNMNAYIKFAEILSISSQDIEGIRNNGGTESRPDGQPKSNIALTFSKHTGYPHWFIYVVLNIFLDD